MIRSMQRDFLKRKIGSNKIQRAWEQAQIEKYGYLNWLFNMRIQCDPKRRTAFTLINLYGRAGADIEL